MGAKRGRVLDKSADLAANELPELRGLKSPPLPPITEDHPPMNESP